MATDEAVSVRYDLTICEDASDRVIGTAAVVEISGSLGEEGRSTPQVIAFAECEDGNMVDIAYLEVETIAFHENGIEVIGCYNGQRRLWVLTCGVRPNRFVDSPSWID